jgi:hypothetical protein
LSSLQLFESILASLSHTALLWNFSPSLSLQHLRPNQALLTHPNSSDPLCCPVLFYHLQPTFVRLNTSSVLQPSWTHCPELKNTRILNFQYRDCKPQTKFLNFFTIRKKTTIRQKTFFVIQRCHAPFKPIVNTKVS